MKSKPPAGWQKNNRFENWHPRPFWALCIGGGFLVLFYLFLLAGQYLLHRVLQDPMGADIGVTFAASYLAMVPVVGLIIVLQWNVSAVTGLRVPARYPWFYAVPAFIAWVLFFNQLESVFNLFIPLQPQFLDALAAMVSMPLHNLLLSGCAVVIIAPLAEEILFRGILINIVRKSFPLWVPIAFSAFMFTVAHFTQVTALVSLIMLSVLLAIIAVQSDSIIPGIVFHVFNNSFAFAVVLWRTYSGHQAPLQWQLHTAPEDINWWLFAFSTAASVVLGILYMKKLARYNKQRDTV